VCRPACANAVEVVDFMEARRLMVIVSGALSAIVKKGEITPHYFNPGELFEEVHIVMTNDDRVNPEDLRKTVGKARLCLHNVPLDSRLFARALRYCPWFLKRWADAGVRLARRIKPDMIRCHENTFNGFMAARIKQELGVPIVISLHGNPDLDLRGPVARTIGEKTRSWAHKAVERPGLRVSDHFIAVYASILPYLRRNRVGHYSLIYNAVGYGAEPKRDYKLHEPARCLCVGRQQSLFKDPTHIVEAFAELPDAELTLIGTGNLHRPLRELAGRLKCDARCKFVQALANEQVLTVMHDSDIYVFNQISQGISKTIIEAALTGLPIVVNRRPSEARDELDADWLIQVDDTKEGYLEAMRRLIHDQKAREQLGRRAYGHARENWRPEQMEEKVVEVYLQVMRNAGTTGAPVNRR